MRVLDAEALLPCPASRFQYQLLVDEIDQNGLFFESYGVKVLDTGTNEAADIPHITVSQPRALDLLGKLVRGQVPPCTLRDVVEDHLAEY